MNEKHKQAFQELKAWCKKHDVLIINNKGGENGIRFVLDISSDEPREFNASYFLHSTPDDAIKEME